MDINTLLLAKAMSGGGVKDTDIKSAVSEYLDENPPENVVIEDQIAAGSSHAVSSGAVAAAMSNKTEKKLLSFDGTKITLNGAVQSFSDVYNYLMVDPFFVVLVYNDIAYHPNTVKNGQIIFISSNVSNGYEEMDRITMHSNGAVTTTNGIAEMRANKVANITEYNKDDEDKYASVAAVVKYIDEVLGSLVNVTLEGK